MSRTSIALAGFASVIAALGAGQLASQIGSGIALAQVAPSATDGAAQTPAGTYRLDADHTQVLWSVDHFGFSRLYGMVGSMSGTLELDPARVAQSRLQVDIPLSGLTVTSDGFAEHLTTPDLFDVARFPVARFVSRRVEVRGEEATITGDLTLRGRTRPVVLEARLYGAGSNPMNRAQTVGFSARGQLKRSEFGLGYAAPAVSDLVELEITAAFEKADG
ncbi:MAG: YceI family protein [Allosphingosinicella sp.]|uniref:YceI family protein n=1 Tax=Allosphingosinicella sp. TaxID=2823234 RepID=UPI00395B15E3